MPSKVNFDDFVDQIPHRKDAIKSNQVPGDAAHVSDSRRIQSGDANERKPSRRVDEIADNAARRNLTHTRRCLGETYPLNLVVVEFKYECPYPALAHRLPRMYGTSALFPIRRSRTGDE